MLTKEANLGRVQTWETREKIREARLGKPSPNKGKTRKPPTEETKRKDTKQ